MDKCIRSTGDVDGHLRGTLQETKSTKRRNQSVDVCALTQVRGARAIAPYQRCLPFSPTTSSRHAHIEAAIASARLNKNEIRICYLKIHFSVGICNVNVHLVCARAPSNSPQREKFFCTNPFISAVTESTSLTLFL